MTERIEIRASDAVAGALARLGRTEDVKFSPDDRRLAIAAYAENKCLVVDVEIHASPARTTVQLEDFLETTSPSFKWPHGLSFVDRDTLIVANRSGAIPILNLPQGPLDNRSVSIPALETISGGPFARLKSPGSVSVTRIENGDYDVLVCNNDANRVTRHVLDGRAPFRVKRNRVLLGRKLRIPDGIAVSPDGHCIAVSSHDKHEVLIYEDAPNLSRRTRATGKLHTITFPHGICFTPDDKYILVADAGMPFVHLFAQDGNGWRGDHHPVGSVRVMDDETYFRGRQNPRDGGPKGIAIDSNMQVLTVTNETQPLAFFDLPAILARPKLAWRPSAAA